MRIKFLIFLNLFAILFGHAQNEKQEYLSKNKFDLNSLEKFPQKGMKIVGFGAYHGSAKTEDTEILLLKSILKNEQIRYYFPETDCSIAYFFNQYLKSGDEVLLEDLVKTYGTRVPQERAIEVFNKWKKLREINNGLSARNKITVVGVDIIVSYKYTFKHLLRLTRGGEGKWKKRDDLNRLLEIDSTDFYPYRNTNAKNVLKDFVADYNSNKFSLDRFVSDNEEFTHLMSTIKASFDKSSREKSNFENYKSLAQIYNFENDLKFFRYGFSHLLKIKEDDAAGTSFFTQLIENKVYNKEEIVSILGFLTDSRVLWDDIFENGKYVSSTTEGGFGIGDYEKEYFKGIEEFKKQKVSDKTLFRLNQKDNIYFQKGNSDLIEVILDPKPEKQIDYSKKATAEFIDYSILISNSKANISIYELNKK
jgi:hypothetical protein